MRITKPFEIKYLSFHSVCLFQAYPEAWRHEASDVDNIHAISCCRIATTEAANSDQICFFELDLSLVSPCVVRSGHSDQG